MNNTLGAGAGAGAGDRLDVGTADRSTHTGTGTDTDIDKVLQLEIALLDPSVRSDPARLNALLHPDFLEHGASGRIWTRQAIIDELPFEGDHAPRTSATDVLGQHIASDAILVTYRTTSALKTAVRSSLWLKSAAGAWQLRFHQGTPIPNQIDPR